MKNCIYKIVFLFFLITSKSFALVSVDITRGNLDPLPVAISNFYFDVNIDNNLKKTNIENKIPELVQNNLTRSGLFFALDKKSFIQKPEVAHNKPRFEDWSFIKAQVLVTGKISLEKDGRLKVEFKLWDVVSATELSALAFYTAPDNWRRVAHLISDKIYERLTGEKGYFDTRIIYVAETGPKVNRKKRLAVMDQDGFGVKYLTLGNEIVLTPRFSPTNQLVTYMSYYKNLPRVYLLNIETGLQDLVGDFPGMTFAPRFSPDGQKVVMSLAKGSASNIYVMDLRSRSTTRLTDTNAIDTSPSYSPDGSQIVFESDRGGSQQIYIMSSSGGAAKRLSFGEGARYSTPVWSPKGDYIAFTRQKGGQFAIGIMKPDGSGERILTEGFHNEGPTWAPNGRYLMFFRDQPGASGARIYMVDTTGRVENTVPTQNFSSDPAWSPLLK